MRGTLKIFISDSNFFYNKKLETWQVFLIIRLGDNDKAFDLAVFAKGNDDIVEDFVFRTIVCN